MMASRCGSRRGKACCCGWGSDAFQFAIFNLQFSMHFKLKIESQIRPHPCPLPKGEGERAALAGAVVGRVAGNLGFGVPASLCLTSAMLSFVTGSQEIRHTSNSGSRE